MPLEWHGTSSTINNVMVPFCTLKSGMVPLTNSSLVPLVFFRVVWNLEYSKSGMIPFVP